LKVSKPEPKVTRTFLRKIKFNEQPSTFGFYLYPSKAFASLLRLHNSNQSDISRSLPPLMGRLEDKQAAITTLILLFNVGLSGWTMFACVVVRKFGEKDKHVELGQ